MNTIKSILHQIVPPDPTIAELEAKAAEYEEKSANEPEPQAAEMRKQAKLSRG